MTKPLNFLWSWFRKKKNTFTSSKFFQIVILQEKKNIFFISTMMPSLNKDCINAKFASALAALMWHSVETVVEEVWRYLLQFLRVFIFNHVKKKKKHVNSQGAHGSWKCLIFNLC